MSSEQTKQVYRRRLAIFCDWCGLNPEQLLALKDDPNSLKAEHLLDRFVASPDFSDWQKVNIVTAVKSFYKYSYKELQRISGKISAAKQTPYRTPTAETLRKFINGAWSHRDKALVAFTASTFFREGTIPELNWGDIEDGAILEPNCNGKDVLHIGVLGRQMKGGGKGRYVGIEQHTFLTPEARDLLLEYKRYREERGEIIAKDTPLFVTEMRKAVRNKKGDVVDYGPYKRISVETVRNIFKAASKRSGVKFSPHDFRRYGQTQLEEAGLVPNWIRKILGHKIKGEESPYSRPKIKQLRDAYRDAIPKLQFLTAPEPGVTDEQRILEQLRLQIASLPISEQKRQELLIVARSKKFEISEEAGEWLRKQLTEGKTETNGGCMNENCQRIVSEEELPALLAEGWRVSVVLPSGKVVVSDTS